MKKSLHHMTVKDLIEFLSALDENKTITFADRDNLPCYPYTWEIYSNATEFIKDKIIDDYVDRFLDNIKSINAQDSIVIKASY